MYSNLSFMSHKATGVIIAIGLFLIVLLHTFLILPYIVTCGIAAFFLLVVLFFHRPLYGFIALLAIRTSVDFLDDFFSLSLTDTITLNIAAILGLLMIFASAVLIISNYRTLSHRALILTFGVFILFSGASIIYSIDQGATFQETLRVISIFSAFLSGYILCKKIPHARTLIVSAIIIASIIPLIFAIVQLVTHTGYSDNMGTEGRLFGTFKHPNSFASFLLVIVALLTYRSFDMTIEKQNRRAIIGFLITVITILLLTFSRGGWFALIIFATLLGFLRAPKMLFFLCIAATLLFFTSQTVHDRIEDIYNPPADSSIRWRIQQWQNAIAAWQLSPIYGYGSGTEIAIFEREQGYYAGNPYTHNDVIKVLQETGIIGLVLFTICIVTAFAQLLLAYRSRTGTDDRLFILIIIILFVAQIGFGMSSNIWRGTAVQWCMWTLIACALSLQLGHKKRRITDPSLH